MALPTAARLPAARTADAVPKATAGPMTAYAKTSTTVFPPTINIDASDIEVEVKDCEVPLTGTVDSRHAKRHAEDLAETISGVQHVTLKTAAA